MPRQKKAHPHDLGTSKNIEGETGTTEPAFTRKGKNQGVSRSGGAGSDAGGGRDHRREVKRRGRRPAFPKKKNEPDTGERKCLGGGGGERRAGGVYRGGKTNT